EPWRGWERVQPMGGTISTSDSLVALPGYRSEILLDKGVGLLLWGNSPFYLWRVPIYDSGIVLHKSDKYDADLTLTRGRIVISNRKNNGPAQVRLRFYNEKDKEKDWHEIWNLTLEEPDTEVSVDTVGRYLSEH